MFCRQHGRARVLMTVTPSNVCSPPPPPPHIGKRAILTLHFVHYPRYYVLRWSIIRLFEDRSQCCHRLENSFYVVLFQDSFHFIRVSGFTLDIYFNLPIREDGNACVEKRNGLFVVHHIGALNREFSVWIDCVQTAVEVAKIL